MGMETPRYNLGRLTWIGAEAIGVPGQRTFRLLLAAESASAHLWLEKEQLQALAEGIGRILIEHDPESEIELTEKGATPALNPKPPGFPPTPDIEFHVGTIGIGFDQVRDAAALEIADREDEEERGPALRCLLTREQLAKLQGNIVEVVSAGRPRCPFCGTPLSTPGVPHFCPPQNGHQKLTGEE